MKKIYICSRYRADNDVQFEKQLEYTKAVAREVVLFGFDVVVPHLLYPQFLDDSDEAEREVGIGLALNSLKDCDLIIVNTLYGVSDGMEREIAESKKLMIDMVITFNLRSLKNYLTLRDSSAAFFQIRWLAQEMMRKTPSKYLDLIIKKK